MGPWACLKIGYPPNPLVFQFIPLVFPFKLHGLSCFIIIFLSSRPMVYHHFPHSNSHRWRVSDGIPMAGRVYPIDKSTTSLSCGIGASAASSSEKGDHGGCELKKTRYMAEMMVASIYYNSSK